MTARVLVVGGWFQHAKRIERALVLEGFEVAIATNIKDCIAAGGSGAFDLAILDGSGPGPDIVDLCRRLKTIPETMRSSLIVLSRDGEPLLRLHALDAGADECLTLPCSDETLVARVQSVAEAKRLADRVYQATLLKSLIDQPNSTVPNAVRVLVLDRDERSRRRLSELLSVEFAVAGETSPAAALLKASEGAYDIALVSLEHSADKDGLGLGRQLRLVDRSGLLRVVLLADSDEVPMRAVRNHGIDDRLLRPIDRSEALARTRLAARKHALQAALRTAERVLPWPVPTPSALNRRLPPERFAA